MILESIRIREYKNIQDSGDVRIRGGVTCLVGKNESGKTSLLEALYRLNPLTTGHPETFVALRDYPRRRYGRDREHAPGIRPITATFELEEEDVQAVEDVYGQGVLAARRVTVSRSYDNEALWEFQCNEERAHPAPPAQELRSRNAATEEAVEEGAHPAAPVQELRSRDAATEEEVEQGLHSGIVPGTTPRDLPDGGTTLRDTPDGPPPTQVDRNLRAGVRRILERRLPGFLYFDEYSVMSGRLSVPRLQGGDANALGPSERTALSLLRLADVDLSDFDARDYESRKASLEAAANEITDEVLRYWSQNPLLSVDLDIDLDGHGAAGAPFIDIRIRNQRHRITLNFSERSQGFTWFFSFLATLSELRRSERTVLLLDEPGLGLHAAAQRDLLRFIDERLAPAHQVIYSTHSPFMVTSTDLERVRTVEDQDGAGSRVSHEFFDHSEDTRLPLQASLGRELIRSLPVGADTLLVEGPSDHVFLTALSSHLEQQGRSSLDRRWTVVPVGGLSGVCAFATLLQASPNVAIIVDLHGREERLAESPLGREMIAREGVIRLADITGTQEADIEDLFAESFYMDLVNRSNAAAVESFEVQGDGRIVERIETATGTGFNRFLPARFLLEHPEALSERLDDPTLDRFETLFKKVNESIGAR